MGEIELDGEENLIIAAKYLVKELRSGKSLTKTAKNVLGHLLSELSRVVITDNKDEEGETDEIERKLNVISEKIMAREADESMIWDLGSDEGNEYLNGVHELRVLIDQLEDSSGSGKTGTEEISLRKAHDVLQMAMGRLEDEFKYLLVENRLPFELEHASSHFNEVDNAAEEGSVTSLGAVSTEDLLPGAENRRNSVEMVVDLINPDVISDLKNIANAMISAGYDRECIQICTMVRKDALDEFLYSHEIEKLSIEDVLKMDWATLNSNIKKWVRVMRNIIQIYLVSEKSLDFQIFGESNQIGLTCFVDTVKAPVMQLLNFGEAVSLGPRQPEKLLRILEMYELGSGLLPEIDGLFSDQGGSAIRLDYREVMRRLGDCARSTFLEFKNAIASDVSSHPIAGGAVHPLTNYVMNYLMALTDFGETLNSLLMEHDDMEDLAKPPSPDLINPLNEQEFTYENSSSPEKFMAMTRHFYSITSVLEANLIEKSKLYKDVSLRHIFLLNNIHYMTRKVLNSELRHIFGDKWNRKHTWKFQQEANEYERATWLPVLSSLKEESGSGSGSRTRNLGPKERFQSFNAAFEEVYKAQTAWLIADERLREDVRTKASMWVIQAYWTFYSKHKNNVSEKYIKYTTDDIERLLLDLFAGSPKSLSNSYRR